MILPNILDSAIPNGVVNSFSTVIIKDMGFSTTRTTELKSVGDATQVIGLLISGAIILNVPNCKSALTITLLLMLNYYSTFDRRYRGQHHLYCCCRMYGIYP